MVDGAYCNDSKRRVETVRVSIFTSESTSDSFLLRFIGKSRTVECCLQTCPELKHSGDSNKPCRLHCCWVVARITDLDALIYHGAQTFLLLNTPCLPKPPHAALRSVRHEIRTLSVTSRHSYTPSLPSKGEHRQFGGRTVTGRGKHTTQWRTRNSR